MPEQEQQTVAVPIQNTGITTRIEPKKLPPGAMQFMVNAICEQEGALTGRRGSLLLGTLPGGASNPHQMAKLSITSGEVPGTPTANLRYIGEQGDIYRSTTMATGSFTKVNPSAVCSTPGSSTLSHFWNMAAYSAGASGNPWAFFAGEKLMLKDNGTSPFGAGGLLNWGILPAFGVPKAQTVTVTAATNASPIQITTSIEHKQSSGDQVGIQGVGGNLAANGQFYVTVIDAMNFRLYSDPGQTVPVAGTGTYTSGGFVANLQGGFPSGSAAGAPPGSSPYQYVYTYASSKTLNQGNPSQPMIAASAVTNGSPVAVYNNYIHVTGIYGTNDPQIDLIYLYRSGGTFTDGLYRQAQVFANNPGNGLEFDYGPYDDFMSDSLANGQPLAEFDNDAPVTSTAKTPITSKLSGGFGPGWSTITTTSGMFAFGGAYGATVGSLLHFVGSEDCIIETITSTTQARVYLQKAQASGANLEVDAIAGQASYLSCQAFDSVFVAGDPNNPHVLYKSKTGRPESFPVIDSSGNSGSINVGSPANGIVGLCEFRGNVVTLNVKNIFEVPVFNGLMYSPNVTPAQRGLAAQNAYCIADNEIWYLAYDGIWSWSGGESQKRSDAIDALFHGLSIPSLSSSSGPIAPLNMSPFALQYCRMMCNRNQIVFLYPNTNGHMQYLKYDRTFSRWEPMSQGIANAEDRNNFLEVDTGNWIHLRNDASAGTITLMDFLDPNGYTSDECTGTATSSGTAIRWRAQTGWMDMGDEFTVKVFDEVLLDIDAQGPSGQTSVIVNVYYDYSTSVGDTFTIPGNNVAGPSRAWMALQTNLLADTHQSNALSMYGRSAQVIAFEFVVAPAPLGYRPVIYGFKFKYRPVGELTAGPLVDWVNLGSNFDKRLHTMTVEFDTAGVGRTLILDTMSGINGNTYTPDVQTFAITNPAIVGPGRAMQTFGLNDGIIAKLVRIRALSTASGANAPATTFFRILNLEFEKEVFPPDIVLFTEPKDFGWPWDKVARSLTLKIDTGGVACVVQPVADGANAGSSFNITTTLDDWQRVVPMSSTLIGKLWKLKLTPGGGGKAQLFEWNLDFVKEPAAVTAIDTLETDFSYNGFKWIKQIWVDYQGPASLTFTILVDGGSTFFTQTLPSHANRDVERFYLPAINGGVLNKSRQYRIQVTSASAFKLYSNTKIEWMPIGADQRQGFQQFMLSPEQQLPVGVAA